MMMIVLLPWPAWLCTLITHADIVQLVTLACVAVHINNTR